MAYNVLIVDDSPAMRSFVRRVLDMSGLEIGRCLQAENGLAAIDVLRADWVDVVLTDINMPVMDGDRFVRTIKADEELSPIPVIVVSTDKSESRVQQMMDLGAKGYVTKPFMPETLRDAIENALGVNRAW
jgi:two-component system, chemotaxis family, chemotaxis protein CheY